MDTPEWSQTEENEMSQVDITEIKQREARGAKETETCETNIEKLDKSALKQKLRGSKTIESQSVNLFILKTVSPLVTEKNGNTQRQ